MVRRPVVSRGLEAEFRAFADEEVRLHVNSLLGTLHPRTRIEREFIPPSVVLLISTALLMSCSCSSTHLHLFLAHASNTLLSVQRNARLSNV